MIESNGQRSGGDTDSRGQTMDEEEPQDFFMRFRNTTRNLVKENQLVIAIIIAGVIGIAIGAMYVNSTIPEAAEVISKNPYDVALYLQYNHQPVSDAINEDPDLLQEMVDKHPDVIEEWVQTKIDAYVVENEADIAASYIEKHYRP